MLGIFTSGELVVTRLECRVEFEDCMKNVNWWLELILFNGIWALCVFGQSDYLIWAAIGVLVLAFMTRATWEKSLVYMLVLGLLFDSIATLLTIFNFSSSTFVLPVWLLVIWVAFVLTLSSSLAWIWKRSSWQAGLIMATAGCVSYTVALRGEGYYWGFSSMVTSAWLLSVWLVLGLFGHYCLSKQEVNE